jgi:hypothetical protein
MKDNFKINIKEKGVKGETDSPNSRYGLIIGSCEHGTELLFSMNGKEFLD